MLLTVKVELPELPDGHRGVGRRACGYVSKCQIAVDTDDPGRAADSWKLKPLWVRTSVPNRVPGMSLAFGCSSYKSNEACPPPGVRHAIDGGLEVLEAEAGLQVILSRPTCRRGCC